MGSTGTARFLAGLSESMERIEVMLCDHYLGDTRHVPRDVEGPNPDQDPEVSLRDRTGVATRARSLTPILTQKRAGRKQLRVAGRFPHNLAWSRSPATAGRHPQDPCRMLRTRPVPLERHGLHRNSPVWGPGCPNLWSGLRWCYVITIWVTLVTLFVTLKARSRIKIRK